MTKNVPKFEAALKKPIQELGRGVKNN